MITSRTRLAVAGLVVVSLLAVGCGSKGSDTTADTSSSTATSTSTSIDTTSTPSTTAPSETAVWPFSSSSTRYTDPVEAVRSFAVSYLGFVDPVVGPFQQGDTRSGEVVIKPNSSGPSTTVLVRQLAPDDSWWVLGASTPDLRLEAPAARAVVTSPLTLSGQSTAFEATVNFEIRQDGTMTPLAADYFMGGSMGQMGPFSKTETYATPSATHGAIVLMTSSAENGHLWEATVVPVTFSP
ncbi:MAG: Gmad2 immunoglobulin-like domain-containing protein [Acidimicrobiales bacterium]